LDENVQKMCCTERIGNLIENKWIDNERRFAEINKVPPSWEMFDLNNWYMGWNENIKMLLQVKDSILHNFQEDNDWFK
jgi:hypothetical protein